MERAIRFNAADWRDGDRLNKDKLAAAISSVLAKTFSAKVSASTWNANTGKLKLTFKRPSQLFPALDLTETIEVNAMAAPDKPGGSHRLMLWIGNPLLSTPDEAAGPKLNLAEEASSDQEGGQKDDHGSVHGLGHEFQGQPSGVGKSA